MLVSYTPRKMQSICVWPPFCPVFFSSFYGTLHGEVCYIHFMQLFRYFDDFLTVSRRQKSACSRSFESAQRVLGSVMTVQGHMNYATNFKQGTILDFWNFPFAYKKACLLDVLSTCNKMSATLWNRSFKNYEASESHRFANILLSKKFLRRMHASFDVKNRHDMRNPTVGLFWVAIQKTRRWRVILWRPLKKEKRVWKGYLVYTQ